MRCCSTPMIDTPMDVLAAYRVNSGQMVPFFVCHYARNFQFCTDAQRLRIMHLLECALGSARKCPLDGFARACLRRFKTGKGLPRLPDKKLLERSKDIEPRAPRASHLRAMLVDLKRLHAGVTH